MITKIDQAVIDHCAKFKLCKGCPLNCVAPVSDRDFDAWINKKIIEVKDLCLSQK